MNSLFRHQRKTSIPHSMIICIGICMIFSMLIDCADYQIFVIRITLITIHMVYNVSIRYMLYVVFSYSTVYQQYYLLTFARSVTEHSRYRWIPC